MESCELWQGYNEAYSAVVLECVFNYLSPRDLWRCGSVCRAWRRTATDSALWRHLMLPHATPNILRTITVTQHNAQNEWSWRKEYALQTARWERCGRLQARSASSASAPLQCAALHDSGALLAVVDEDAYVTIWEQTSVEQWSVRWSGAASPAWRGVAQARWAPHAARLLLAGRLALVDRYEMLVMHFDEEWCSRVICRSASGPGSAGCWVNDDSFLSLRLRLLAPGHACTTLWLNAASLEVYSEHAGVATPLLRIYNEAAAHISHILVAEVYSEEVEKLCHQENKIDNQDFSIEPGASYYSSINPHKPTKEIDRKQRVLIGAGGVAGGARGEAQALLLWVLPSLEMPLLWVGDELAQRVRERRQRARAPAAAPDEPDEAAVRAFCSKPAAALCLRSLILGIVLHPRGGCVWATTEAGATCASLPALAPLLHIPRAASTEVGLPPHLLQPCVDDDYFVTPAGAGSGGVRVWTARTGRSAARLAHGAPALAAFLPPSAGARAPRRLLVLATDALHVLRSLTCDESGRARRVSCTPGPEAACAPCEAAPRPACRAPQEPRRAGERRVCCAPAHGPRPPCAAPAPPRPRTCEHGSKAIQNFENIATIEYNAQKPVCGAQLDKVAMRLEAAERARRLDYEQEVALEITPLASFSKPYKISGTHECLRATDGRDYTLASKTTTSSTRCSADRIPPPPCPLSLKPEDNCQIHRGHHLDPCAHQPRVFLEIDRNGSNSADLTLSSNKITKDASIANDVKQVSSTSSCPRQTCKPQSAEKSFESNSKSWCNSLPSPDIPTRCKEQSFIERLRLRPGGMSSQNCTPQRQIHTSSKWFTKPPSLTNKSIAKEEKTCSKKLTSILDDRMELEETGRGRIVTALDNENSNKSLGAGGLELKVPPNADSVRVRVSLDFDNAAPATCRVSKLSDEAYSHTYSSCKSDGGSDSWLSIKNLQKKLSGYRKSETSKDVKKTQDLGKCKRSNVDEKAMPEKKSTCSSPPSQKQMSDKPPSRCSQTPCQQSPCAPRAPKTTTSRYSSLQNIFDLDLDESGTPYVQL